MAFSSVETNGHVEKAAPDFMELGRSGLSVWNGEVQHEFLRELQGAKGRRAYREMRDNHPIVGAMLFAFEQLASQVTWDAVPASDAQDDQAQAQFLRECMQDMSVAWPTTLSEILSMLVWGWGLTETVYKRRDGDVRDPTRHSRFTDGRIGWRKFAIRGQESLFRWQLDDTGGVQAMVQQAPADTQTRVIPIEKALLFRTKSRLNNPEGVSILRTAYPSYWYSKHIERIMGIGIERDMAGYPTFTVDREGPDIWNTKDPKAVATKEEIVRTAKNIRRDEQEGMVLPWWLKFELVTTGSRRAFDLPTILQFYDRRIALTVLADFILLGHESVGSFSLESSRQRLFGLALDGYLFGIAEVINQHEVPRLWRYNGWRTNRLPRWVPKPSQPVNLAELGAYIGQLAGAGFPLFPDQELERHLKQVARLPTDGTDLEKRGEQQDDRQLFADAVRALRQEVEELRHARPSPDAAH
jgi:hypothetical protein